MTGPGDLSTLPPPRGDLAAVARLVLEVRRKVVVLDDDPTGTQTVHGIDVLTEWSETALAAALADPRPCFFVLTNSRSLPEPAAVELARTLMINLRAAARATGRAYEVISRSDSTLRGHFPAEIDALLSVDRGYDGVMVAPAFLEVGRITVGDVHYVRDGERVVPAGETEFARDATFGYQASNLRHWIEEKSRGRVSAATVASVALETLRDHRGPERVRDQLLGLPRGGFVVVNAADYGDLEVFMQGLLLAEAAGRRFLARTAASYVRVRAGLPAKALLDATALKGPEGHGGLVIVGSYTAKTTEQLHAALARPDTGGVELHVSRLAESGGLAREVSRLAPAIEAELRAGRTAIVFTSRERETALGQAGDLAAGRTVSDALVTLVRALAVRPRFVIAKGGITSSDIAVKALGVRRALILGQAAAGVPVWRIGPESRWPGLGYVVFPGNVGAPDTLAALVKKLSA
jgi:uncharacterized protein YgbK (DUF1537 family)